MEFSVAENDERQQPLLDRLGAAASALHDLVEAERTSAAGGVELLERVIVYADSVVRQTDGELITDGAVTAIGDHADALADDPAGIPATNARAYADAILGGVALLPAARDREVEQSVREAAANFQRSATHRLNAIEADAEVATERIRQRLEELRAQVSEVSTASTAEIESHATAFEAKLAEFETTITTQQSRLDTIIQRQADSFTEKQEERSETFQDEIDAFKGRLENLLETTKTEVDERVGEIRRMEEESSGLAHSIGLGGTAERYGDEAKCSRP